METHKIIDVINNKIVFTGTYNECLIWKEEHGFGYKIVPIDYNQ